MAQAPKIPDNEKGASENLTRALECEDWSSIVAMARDPRSAALVTSAKVGWGGGTALHMASYCHKVDVSMVLLDAGSLLTSKDKEGYTPLHIAALSGSQNVAELLLTRGADVSAVNTYGWTPLHACAVNGHVQVALLLMEHGAKVGAKANDGRTALDIALASKRSEMVEALQGSHASSKAKVRRRIIIDDDEEEEDESSNPNVNTEKLPRPKARKKDSTATGQRQRISAGGSGPQGSKQNEPRGNSEARGDSGMQNDVVMNDIIGGVASGEMKSVEAQQNSTHGKLRGAPENASRQGRKRSKSTSITPQAPQEWERNLQSSPLSRDMVRQDPSPGVGCPSMPDSPGALQNTPTPEKGTGEHQGVAASPGLPVLPPPPPLVQIRQPAVIDGDQNGLCFSPVDIGKLSVDEVGDLLARYICEGHDDETKASFRDRITRGVKSYRLTGRALLAKEPYPNELACAILSERSYIHEEQAMEVNPVKRDVLYFSLIDAIRVARSQPSLSPAFSSSPVLTPHGEARPASADGSHAS